MIMIPLIFSSIILGIVSHSGDQLKKMGIRVGGYFIATTTISITLGVALALFFKPGKYIFDRGAFEIPDTSTNLSETVSPFSDIPSALLELIPSNPLQAMLSGEMLRDRKSTRLNSSHVRISYAVFCLKKKTQQQHRW